MRLSLSRTLQVVALAIAWLLSSGCSQSPTEPEKNDAAKVAAKIDAQEAVRKYSLDGQVLHLDSVGKIVTVKHQAIGDWMGAMTMEFPVKDPADFAKLKEGSPVHATVFVQGINYWVGDVKDAGVAPAPAK
jgi:Cu/Ag efflux protein CusF